MSAVVVECQGLTAGYGSTAVVRDVDLTVAAGEIVALLGPNGAGKTTTLLTIAALLPTIRGTVTTAKAVLVPDDRSLFQTLTVKENIQLAAMRRTAGLTAALNYFPQLETRLNVRAGLLSGGEQQMLAIARALVQRPEALLIDELSMGLAPVVVQRLLPVLTDVAKRTGTGIVLVEQHARLALEIADRAVVLVHGRKALDRPAHEIAADPGRLERLYLAT